MEMLKRFEKAGNCKAKILHKNMISSLVDNLRLARNPYDYTKKLRILRRLARLEKSWEKSTPIKDWFREEIGSRLANQDSLEIYALLKEKIHYYIDGVELAKIFFTHKAQLKAILLDLHKKLIDFNESLNYGIKLIDYIYQEQYSIFYLSRLLNFLIVEDKIFFPRIRSAFFSKFVKQILKTIKSK